LKVQVSLSARVVGTDSLEAPSFDNCAYYHAMASASGPAALAYTLTVPVYSLDLVSAGSGSGTTVGSGTYPSGQTVAVSATPSSGSTFAGWTGPNAAECATGSVILDADKSCSATFNALDSDGDGLSDTYEISIGTNPNNPDTDGDGLRDDAELTRGTNPLVADTDADGLTDGNEVTRGTNPCWRIPTGTA
jgi:hypothetical protein